MGLSSTHRDLIDVIRLREHTIDGEQEPSYWVDHLERHVRQCPARDVVALLLRTFPLVHATIHYGPPLANGLGPEHELHVMGAGHIDACANDLRPGAYVIGAGYVPFAFDGDGKDQHFIGPHPDTDDLTVLQVFRSHVRASVSALAPHQCHVHAPTVVDFFRACSFAPLASRAHPPRK